MKRLLAWFILWTVGSIVAGLVIAAAVLHWQAAVVAVGIPVAVFAVAWALVEVNWDD